MEKRKIGLSKERERSDTSFSHAPDSHEQQVIRRRLEALETLQGIGWANDLEAMRLGSADHSAK